MLSNILARFCFPREIITNNDKAFTSTKLVKFCNDYNIILSHSTAYYPQGNGLAESSNKSLVKQLRSLSKIAKRHGTQNWYMLYGLTG